MTVIIKDILDSKSNEVLVGKAVLAIASIEFEVEDEEVAFVEAIVLDSSFDTMKEHRGKPEKIERETETETEILVLNESLITIEFVMYNIYTVKKA